MAMVKRSLLFLAMASLSGCVRPDPETAFQDDLEKLCGALPCGWTVESGSASRSATYHEGEHGLRLEAESAARFTVGSGSGVRLPSSANLQFMILCDPGVGLDVSFGYDDGTGPSEVSLAGTVAAGTDTREVPHASFPIPPLGGDAGVLPELRFLRFATLGPGACTIDDLWIFVPSVCGG